MAKIDPALPIELQTFLDKAKEVGLYVERGDNSLKLKFTSNGVELNFAVFKTNGTLQNYRIASFTNRIGHPEIGENYLARLASLFEGGYVEKHPNRFLWTVKRGANENVTIPECLAVQDEWLTIIQGTVSELLEIQAENEN